MVTNKEGSFFTITDLEVWEVKFIVIYNIILINIGLRERKERKREREKERKERKERSHTGSRQYTLTLF